MLGNRRPSPQLILVLSLLLALGAGVIAYRYGMAQNWLWTAVWGIVAVWLLIDVWRAYGWTKNGRPLQEAGPARQTPPPPPPAPASGQVNVDPRVTGAPTNPLLREPTSSGPEQPER